MFDGDSWRLELHWERQLLLHGGISSFESAVWEVPKITGPVSEDVDTCDPRICWRPYMWGIH